MTVLDAHGTWPGQIADECKRVLIEIVRANLTPRSPGESLHCPATPVKETASSSNMWECRSEMKVFLCGHGNWHVEDGWFSLPNRDEGV
jgi:hypothetical protein